MRRNNLKYLAGAAVLAALAWPLMPAAQGIPEDEGGARADAGVTFGLELDNGTPEFRTDFDFDLVTATRTQSLTFSGDFGVVVPLDDLAETRLTDPGYGLDYLRDTGRTRLRFSADYSATEIEDLRRQPDDPASAFDESILSLSDDGRRARIAAQAILETGLTDPVGTEFRYRFNDVSYTDVTDPDLVDSVVNEVAGAVRMDVDQTLRFGVDGQWRLTERAGLFPQDELRTRIGSSLVWQPRPDMEVRGTLAHVAITTDTTVGAVTTRAENDGINMTLGADLDRPNGRYRFDASHLLWAPGFVDRVELGREMELARGGRLSFSVGATALPSGTHAAVAGLDFGRDTSRGAVVVSLDWDAMLNEENEEVRRGILRARYSEELPQGARWSLAARVTDSTFLTGPDPDVATARLAFDYSHPLTEDWDLAAGTSVQVIREDGATGETVDSRLFLSLERRFSLRR